MSVLYVAIGSAIGGVARFLLGGALQRSNSSFPFGTLTVNVLGAFAIGLVARYALDSPDFSPELRVFITTGLCGGFTTFSAFSLETVELMERGHAPAAITYVAASLTLGLLATAAGITLAKNLAQG